MILVKTNARAGLAAVLTKLLLLALAGCAGARVDVSAAKAHYPLSLSPVVRDRSGLLFDQRSLRKTGNFLVSKASVGLLYSAFTPQSPYDISHEVDTQVGAAAGEAIVNLVITVRSSCNILNGFPFLGALPFWPGCVPVTITGDIVRRRSADSAHP